jgi:hypothetical protein
MAGDTDKSNWRRRQHSHFLHSETMGYSPEITLRTDKSCHPFFPLEGFFIRVAIRRRQKPVKGAGPNEIKVTYA